MTSSDEPAPGGGDLGGHDTAIALLRELADILGETGLTEIEFESGGTKIRIGKTAACAGIAIGSAMAPAAPATLAQSAVTDTAQDAAGSAAPMTNSQSGAPGHPGATGHPGAVKSPMVGTAYMAPSPGAAAFVTLGDEVADGQTLLIIEAMKTMNEIKSPRAGKVIEIIAKDAEPVEFGEILMIIG